MFIANSFSRASLDGTDFRQAYDACAPWDWGMIYALLAYRTVPFK
jgi:hypothetical protein